jgi:DNA-binding NtrC family response regulator
MTDILKVLIVDDEADYLETLVKRMRKRSVDITGVHSGEEALDWLAQNVVDVVVLDVKMPGMDGIQALREIKKQYPLVEVIMLTGHANVEVAIEGMELGAFDYLMKPMEIDELLYKIQDAFKKKIIQQEKINYVEKQGGKNIE